MFTESASEYLMYSTIKIECEYKGGTQGSGTGFFFSFSTNIANASIPVIVTNKHVIRNSEYAKLRFTKRDSNGKPLDLEHYLVQISNFEQRWIMHPDENVDICVMPIATILNSAEESGHGLFFTSLIESMLVPNNKLDSLKAIEDVIMIGYPTGISDTYNNKPIFRKGITATHYKFDYNNKKEFLIDAACFPGSSGSPVFVCNEGTFSEKDTNKAYIGTRLYFLGILYAGPQFTSEGKIIVVDTPTVQQPIAISRIPNNLGYVIKASCLMDFASIFNSGPNL